MGKAKAKAKKKTTGARAKRDRRRKLATEAPASAEELLASVPGLDALQDVPAFDDLPVDAAQQAAFDDFCAQAEQPEQMQLGAVVRLDRGFPLVATADDTFRAEHAVGFAKSRGEDEVLLPAVGDRVAVRRAPGHDMGVIECVLPRRTSFERWRGRARGERQVLCSNVDSVLIVQALGAGEVLLDRVARSLVLALDCDAEPVVVLTKADRCEADELERDLDRVRRLVGPDVRVIVTSSAEGRGLDEVRVCVPAGSCAMILGESGAGKSTLLSVVSAAKPKIANYAFTTLEPNLGIVECRDGKSFVMADIPGIIEGAHEGRGLGLRFLRHIERNSVLLFMVPADADDIRREYEILLGELTQYNPELLDKQRLLAVTKSDMLDEQLIAEMRTHLPEGIPALFISSVTGYNIPQLKDLLWEALHK